MTLYPFAILKKWLEFLPIDQHVDILTTEYIF